MWCVCVCIGILYIYIGMLYIGMLLDHKEEWNVDICSSIDRSRRYYVKWNKWDRER